jgi:hypothetical protein
MKLVCALLTPLLVIAGSSVSKTTTEVSERQPDIITAEQASHWMQQYYTEPEPDKLMPAMKVLAKAGALDKPNLCIIIFVGAVFADNPERINQWVTEFQEFTPEQQIYYLLSALWYANTEKSLKALKTIRANASAIVSKHIDHLLENPAPPPLKKAVTTPASLDVFWSEYFATGDERFVIKIIQVLPWSSEGETDHGTIGSAAVWSLTSNAKQDPHVLAICEQQLDKQSSTVKPYLQKVIEQAKKSTSQR